MGSVFRYPFFFLKTIFYYCTRLPLKTRAVKMKNKEWQNIC